MSGGEVLSWMAIGAAAAIAGMIWPFRRGTLGVVANLVAGILGAIAFGLASGVLIPAVAPFRLCFAALGALLALLGTHAAWNRYVRDRRRSVTG
jgi:uncharacterized membrane protein YeaQ/YmgE (transglycosylase-associated protein family)